MIFSTQPRAQGLYSPASEHDSCGVAMVADSLGRRSHSIVADALTALANLEHRGAAGAEPTSGDGAGILLQVPDALLRAEVGFALPEPDADGAGAYAVGLAFLPVEDDQRAKAMELIERIAVEEQLRVLGWRDLPVHPDAAGVGPSAQACMPRFAHLFVGAETGRADTDSPAVRSPVTGIALDRLAFCLRKRAERDTASMGCPTYFASLSSRTLVYKGMLTTHQLPAFFADLTDRRLESAIAVVHSRFSTNTFPSWPLA
ncbi:MAG: glutamate synthase subunit alpha, partial [Candidatus Dormibacteraeota bacterium]|nr:glutamate synthase subunit alpha [Candidatus Dormibacteraeota bacterium]